MLKQLNDLYIRIKTFDEQNGHKPDFPEDWVNGLLESIEGAVTHVNEFDHQQYHADQRYNALENEADARRGG